MRMHRCSICLKKFKTVAGRNIHFKRVHVVLKPSKPSISVEQDIADIIDSTTSMSICLREDEIVKAINKSNVNLAHQLCVHHDLDVR